MKHLILIALLLIGTNFLLAQSFSKDDLVGKWRNTKITDDQGNKQEIIPITKSDSVSVDRTIHEYLTFKIDGTCMVTFEDSEETYDQSGPYDYSINGSTLKIGNSSYQIIELEKDAMIIKEQDDYSLFAWQEHFEKIKTGANKE